jgi:hypothetical protein
VGALPRAISRARLAAASMRATGFRSRHWKGADHQDVLGRDLVAQILGHALAAPAVAQGHGHGALGVVLADDEAVQLGDDFTGRQVGHSFFQKRLCAALSFAARRLAT